MVQLRLFWVFFIITIPFVVVTPTQVPKTKAIQIIRKPVVRVFDPSFKGKPEEEIEQLEHELSDAVRNKDGIELGKLLSDSVLIAGLIGNKDQYIALLKAADKKYYSLEKSEMRIQLYGDVAITTGIQKADIDIENGSRLEQTVFLNTWKKIGGQWQCIAVAN